MKILITGSHGFIGKNLTEQLQNKYEIEAPKREQLNLMDTKQVASYLEKHSFDIVIHTANVNTTCRIDTTPYESLDGNLRMFYNLERCKDYFGRMYYFGSGAEYDMQHYIPSMKEQYLGTYLPTDAYGFSKYLMAKTSESNNNIYDLVLFGVFGRYEEWKRRFISNNICNNIVGQPMTIRQNMYFDYIDVDDLVQIMIYWIEHTPIQKRYNICRGSKIDLFSLAKMINTVMGTNTDIVVKQAGWKPEYTGDNSLFCQETQWAGFTPIEASIERLVRFYKEKVG